MTRRHADRLHATAVPVVLVNDSVPRSGLPTVTTAHRVGARIATEHLVALGHRAIGHIGAPPDQASAAQRRQGVRDAARAAGLPEPVVVDGDGAVAGGSGMVGTLVDAGVTGIVAYNDLTAIGALRALRRLGIAVPQRVSIVGFDDIEMAAWTEPPLTTIRQPTRTLGAWAVERLIAAMSDEPNQSDRAALVPELIVRASTAPPA
jgi:DNA-binding LacI/PurR family transcriptional regulator